MSKPNSESRTIVIGGRELLMVITALALLSIAVVIFLLGIARFRDRPEAGAPILTATSSAPMIGQAAATRQPIAQAPTATVEVAPTMVPTPSSAEHIVQPGDSLTGIAILYGVNLEALLTANNLTLDSVIVAGQKLIVPLIPGNEGTYHEVQPGEALSMIAERYGVSAEAIQAANHLADANALFAGQRLFIPGALPVTVTPTVPGPTPTPLPTSAALAELAADGPLQSEWPRSMLGGGYVDDNYPLIHEAPRFTVHYQPGTYAEQHLDEIVTLTENGLEMAEARLEVRLDGRFDMYVAGTLFETPNASLRGLSQSRERRVFILHDGSGTSADNEYFFTHEITHLVAWNTLGQPSTSMLSEGVATWAGRDILEAAGYLPYDQMCLAIYAASQMPSMAVLDADFQAFKGHIRDPFNYFGSACFMDYLIATYGIQPLHGLYHTADYTNLYGASLYSLDADWRGTLEANQGALTVDVATLSDRVSKVSEAYAYVFGNYNGTETMHFAYAAVDRARSALWRGNFAEVDRWLGELTVLTGFVPS